MGRLRNYPKYRRILNLGGKINGIQNNGSYTSLNGEIAEITILEKVGDNDYIVDYKGVKCHALFNWFVCEYYADDVYRRVEQ